MALRFDLVTPERLVRSEEVFMVTVPGTEGDFGVLEGHAPLMSTIRDGELAIQRAPGAATETVAIRGGFAEVGPNGLTVLAESVDADPREANAVQPGPAPARKAPDRA